MQGSQTYWDWTQNHHPFSADGEVRESIEANPDLLAEGKSVTSQRGPKERKAMEILESAVNEALTDRQHQVWVLYYRDQLTQEDIAEKMGISQPAVYDLLRRAYDNVVDYCEAHNTDLSDFTGTGN